MAKKIQVWRLYGPRLAAVLPVDSKEFVFQVTKGVNQTRSTMTSLLEEMTDVLVQNLQVGRTTKLSNGWTFKPVGKKDGSIEIHVTLGKAMTNAVNSDFRGKWINAQNINKTERDLVEMWNAEHPEDQIEIEDDDATPTEPTTDLTPPTV